MATSYDNKDNASYPPPHNPPPPSYSGGDLYPPPPPTSYQSTYYQQPPAAYSYLSCCFLSAITAIVTILGAIFMIAYIVLKPRIPEFRVDSATVSLNFTGTYLNAKWDMTVIVSNPNKKLDVTYDDVLAGVYYGNNKNDDIITAFRIAPFYQPTRSETRLPVHLDVVDEYVKSEIGNSILEARGRGIVQFAVVINALVKLTGFFHPRDTILQFKCDPLNFGVSPNNTWVLLTAVTCQT
ncbi:uncharacterized protein At1g08160-like [Cicer arietinum]|uniref:NDR1/HIN1-like protein 13 n=1 Tax=Cicer arietinum TaxID=3827 RepID=A0A1S2XWX2_CICAR|nr:NDR1/HIN1-like protein 13 [Cicer arietinum]